MFLASSLSFTQTQPMQPPQPIEAPKFEFFGGYLDTGEAPYSDFKFTGFSLPGDFGTHHGLEAAVIRNLNRRLGIKGEFAAHFQDETFQVNVCTQTPCVPVLQNGKLAPRLYSFMGGPEVRLGNRSWRVAPFVHTLFGVAHASATFKTTGSALNFSQTTSETGFAMALGGGVDVRMARRFGLRTSIDFNPKWVGRNDAGERQVQKGLRLAVGILFH
jgi:hypothetical protein